MKVSLNFVVRMTGMLVLAYIGFWFGTSFSGPSLSDSERLATQLLTLAGAGLGLLTTHRLTVEPLRDLVRWLRLMTLGELLVTTFGLVLGLLIGLIMSFTLSLLPDPFHYYTPLIVQLVFGYIGVVVLRQHRKDLVDMVQQLWRRRTILGDEPIPEKVVEQRRYLVDTSAVIDGRIASVSQTGFLEGSLMVPMFVLNELQTLADSTDELRRTKGRRGLDILNQMRKDAVLPVEVIDVDVESAATVDDKLVVLARRFHCPIITNDFNLNKVAELQDVKVLSLNALSDAVRAPVVPGQTLHVVVRSEGREREQGVSFLDDGTMVVIEEARNYVGQGVAAVVTRVYQTASGRIIFAHLSNGRD